MVNKNYVGRKVNGVVQPFYMKGKYVFDLTSEPFGFLNEDGTHTSTAFTKEQVRKEVETSKLNYDWAYMTDELMRQHFGNHFDFKKSDEATELKACESIKELTKAVEAFKSESEKRYYGNAKGEPMKTPTGELLYVVEIKGPETHVVYSNGTTMKIGSFFFKEALKNNKHKEVSAETLAKYFPKLTPAPTKQCVVYTPDNGVTVQKLKRVTTANVSWEPPKKQSPMIISKGKLYFNTTSARVERVITIQDTSLIWTSCHKQKAEPYPKGAFRLATAEEVNVYLKQAGVQ